ncbi:MAG: mechanosensitive ion channel family protein [Alphaproteobacteria bacterium]
MNNFISHILDSNLYTEIFIIFFICSFAYLLVSTTERSLKRLLKAYYKPHRAQYIEIFYYPLVNIAFLLKGAQVQQSLYGKSPLILGSVAFFVALLFERFTRAKIRNRTIISLAGILLFVFALLNIFNFSLPLLRLLESHYVIVFGVPQAIHYDQILSISFALILLFWAAHFLLHLNWRHLKEGGRTRRTSQIKSIFSRVLDGILYFLAYTLALTLLRIDLSALWNFSAEKGLFIYRFIQEWAQTISLTFQSGGNNRGNVEPSEIGLISRFFEASSSFLNQLKDAVSLFLEKGEAPSIQLWGTLLAILLLIFVFFMRKGGRKKDYFTAPKRLEPSFSNRQVKGGTKSLKWLLYVSTFLILGALFWVGSLSFLLLMALIGLSFLMGSQKIISNLFAGFVIKREKAVREGDILELSEGVVGRVKRIHLRYTLVETLRGREFIIPNEEMLSQTVVNLTLSHKKLRVDITLYTAHNTDIKTVQRLMLESAEKNPLCASFPKAACFLTELEPIGQKYLLYFWVEDITNGISDVKSNVISGISSAFLTNGIKLASPLS